MQWIQPTGKGDYLVFYTIQDDDGEIPTQTLYVSHETPTFSAVTGGEPPPVSPLVVPTGSEPMNQLEAACALLAQCNGYGTSGIYQGCVKQFSTPTSTLPGIDAARARFLAGATDCTTIKAAYPEYFNQVGCPLSCIMTGGTCTGATCSNEVAYGNGLQCGTCDTNGNYRYCAGSHMFTVACTGGTVCSQFHGCAASDAGGCSAYQPNPTCIGSTMRGCDQYGLITNQDCSLEEATCVVATNGSASCVPTSTAAMCFPNADSTAGLKCNSAKTALLGCEAGQTKYIACADLGLAQCVDTSIGAYCE